MDYDHKDHILTVYVLTTYGEYQFIDDILIESSGCGILPAVITFQINQDGSYTTLNYQEPEDGGMYLDSIKELFPQRLQARCLNAGEDSALVSDLRSQQDQYAAAYLASIGREAGNRRLRRFGPAFAHRPGCFRRSEQPSDREQGTVQLSPGCG